MQRKHRDREHMADAYARGYFNGWHECFHVCLETVEEEVERGANLWDIGDLLGEAPPKQPRKN
jgi:hypothetical protein